jgi:hypothetical protein
VSTFHVVRFFRILSIEVTVFSYLSSVCFYAVFVVPVPGGSRARALNLLASLKMPRRRRRRARNSALLTLQKMLRNSEKKCTRTGVAMISLRYLFSVLPINCAWNLMQTAIESCFVVGKIDLRSMIILLLLTIIILHHVLLRTG